MTDPRPPRPPVRGLAPILLAGLFLFLAFLQAWSVLKSAPAPAATEGARTIALLSDPTVPRWTLAREPGGDDAAAALAVEDGERRRILVFAQRLPAPAPGRTYVLWLLRPGAGGPTYENAGAFRPGSDPGPDLVVEDATAFRDLAGLAIGEEADAAVKGPTDGPPRWVHRENGR